MSGRLTDKDTGEAHSGASRELLRLQMSGSQAQEDKEVEER